MTKPNMTRRFTLLHVGVGLLAVGLQVSDAIAQSCAIPGRDGPSNLSGVINTYYPGVTGAVAAGATSVPVGSIDLSSGGAATPVVAGDLLIVIQMQDADISTTEGTRYGDGVVDGDARGATALNNAGRYEYCVASGPVAAGTIPVNCGGAGGGLQFAYRQQPAAAVPTGTPSDFKRAYQVVRVPQLSSATVTGTLTAARWNGQSGGVAAVDVAGNLSISGTIDVAGRGFRGGGAVQQPVFFPGPLLQFRRAVGAPDAGGTKGEGIAGTPRFVYDEVANATVDRGVEGYRFGDFNYGAPANGGGGGGQHNAGGGGGGNGGPGGRGGNEFNGNDPNLLGAVQGGYGGDDFSNSEVATYTGSGLLGRVVLGGGGGAGDYNDSLATGQWSSGGAGGGIVLVRAGSLAGSGSINADGRNGRSSDPAVSADAGGGGGAGGSVVLFVQNGIVPAGLSLLARGGRGGDNLQSLGNNETDGPGGGGGGGVYLSNVGGGTSNVIGGGTGVIVGSTNANVGTSGGAVAGSAGVTATITTTETPGTGAGAACLPQLTVTKSTSTPTRVRGLDTTATYTVTVQNGAGRGTAYGLAVQDDLPAPFTYDGAAITPVYAPAACGAGPSPVTGTGTDPASLGTGGGAAAGSFALPAGCSVALTFNVNLNSPAGGTYQNPATVEFSDPTRTSGGTDGAGGNPVVSPGGSHASGVAVGGTGYASASSTAEDVVVSIGTADLSLTNVVAPAAANAGNNVTFTLTVSNGGPDPATGVAVRDSLPSGFTFVSAAPSQGAYVPGTGIWAAGTIAAGGSATLVITARANPTGVYANVAEVSASDMNDPDSTPANGVATEDDQATATPVVNSGAVIGVAKQAVVTPVSAGVFDVAFSLTVRNLAPLGAAYDVQVVDDLAAAFPSPATFVIQAAPTANGGLSANPAFNGVSNRNLLNGSADLPGAGTSTITFTVRVTANGTPGPFTNSATASAAGVDGGPASTTDLSDNGNNVDADNDGNPNEAGENDPTPVGLGGIVTGRAFDDSNGNGVLDAGEPGLANTPVVVTSGGISQTVTTDGNGNFTAPSVPAGNTTVQVTVPVGFTVSTNNSPQTVVVTDGGTLASQPIGLARFATVNGSVWRDLDSDRVRDGGEPGLSGWRIDLLNTTTGAVVLTANSDAAGQYSIANVVPATTYRIRYTSPTGAVFGVGVNGETGTPQAGSVVNPATRSLDVTPLPGVTLTQQSLPVDPQGVVYDTLTRQALAGAQVTLNGPAGFSAATHLLGGAANATQTTGLDGAYQFLLLPAAPAGTYTLTLVAPTGYNAPSAFLPPAGTLDPTGQGIGGVLRVQGQPTPPTDAQPTTYYLSFDLAAGDPDVVNNHIAIDPASLSGGSVRLTKRADRATVSVGGLVAYTITLENTTNTRLPGLEVRDVPPGGFSLVEGSARLDGTATGLAVRGPRPVVFSGIDINPGQRRVLRYVLRVGAGVVRGEYPNTAEPVLLGLSVGSPDTARVTVVADPAFEETTVIGKVFDDADGDGWQDEGEKGVPGVRLATVEGLVAETDAFGRFHFAAVDGGFMERGRNFIVKLDPSTLPPESVITSENPRVSRITPGMPSRFDFGIRLKTLDAPAKRIDLKLLEMYFQNDSAEVAAEFLPLLSDLAARVRTGEKATVVVKVAPPSPEGCTPACQLGRRRIDAVRRTLMRLLGPEGLKNVEVVADYTAAGGIALRDRVGEWLREGLYAVVSLLIPAAHAAPCAPNICATQPVEVRAKFARSLAAPGRYWATEDPSAIDPRLASEGPDRLPVAAGTLDAALKVAIYTNYSPFIDRFEVVVYDREDVDRIRPLATIPVAFQPRSLRNLLMATWNAQGTAAPRSGGLVYLVRATGADGRVDETAPRPIQLVTRVAYDRQLEVARRTGAAPGGALREPSGAGGQAAGVDATPLKGRYVLLKPGMAALIDPVARTAVDASAGIAGAESASEAGLPLEALGLEGALPPRFTRKGLLADLESLEDETLDALYGRNDLARRSIPVYGSRVRVVGQEVPDSAVVRLNGQVIPASMDGSLAYEVLMPVGSHELFLDIVPASGDVWPIPLSVDVTGRHMFMVGLADLTWQNNDVSGSIEPLAADDRYLEKSVTEGRLALYLKGKIRGKYLLTTQLDTHEEQLDEMLENIDEKDPRRLFRSIDPDQYYPVYGDDSTTVSDTDTQGRLYARIEWDRSRAVLGNFNTDFTGTQFSQYNRSLYGANLEWRGLASTRYGESRSSLTAFASEVQTALGHDEFLGTGGSLYYLRHTDVVEGSGKARIEILDPLSDRVVENLTLVEGVDYEIDELQGRVILTKPLLQVARQQAPYMVRSGVLEGNRVVLVMDYEYLPLRFADSAASFGLRGRKWLGDSVAIGATWVDESRDTQDYLLAGADLTLQPARGTYLKLEYAQTEATQSVRYFSPDGGLSFTTLNALSTQAAADNRSGEAMGVEARMNLRERGLTDRDLTLSAWWNRNDNEFAVARRDEGFEVERVGLEAAGSLSETIRVAVRANSIDRGGIRPGTATAVEQLAVQGAWDATERDRVSAEIQYLSQQSVASPEAEATVGAIEYRRILSDAWQAYAIAQLSIDESVDTASGELYTLGTRYALGNRWSIDTEFATGDEGEGVSGTLEYRTSERHSLYGTFSHSVDRSDELIGSDPSLPGSSGLASRGSYYDNPGNNLALGSRWQVSDQLRIFNEAQFSDADTYAGVGHVFGLEFAPRQGWRYGASLQKGDFAVQGGAVERQAASVSVGFNDRRLNWSSRLEYRDDGGVTEATQYLTSNRVDFKLRDSFRLLGKVNFSKTEQDIARLNDGRLFFGQATSDAAFAEASLGLAYRPVDHDRFNWLGKVTYLYDLTSYGQVSSDVAGEGVLSFEQSGRTDQKSLVASWEGVFRLTPSFDLGGKVARRAGEVRLDRSSGDWVDSTANFAAVRVSYELIRKWDALVEYRWLDVPDARSSRKGFLVSIDRELGNHFKLGVGYNFTDFSDDLTNLGYEFRGVFVNAVGKY